MSKSNKLIALVLAIYFVLSCFNYTYAIAIDDSNMSSCFSLVEDYCSSNDITIYDYIITSDGYIYVADKPDYSLFVNHLHDGDFINSTNCMIFHIDSDSTYTLPVANSNGSNYTEVGTDTGVTIVYCSFTLLDNNGDVYYNSFVNPYIANTAEDLATGKFDTILIQPGDSLITDSFDFIIRKISNVDSDGISYESQRIVYSTELDSSSSFFYQLDTDFWFEIPNDSLGINFQNDERYIFSLEKDGNSYQDITVTIGGLTDEDREANMLNSLIASNNKTTDAIKENTEVNKGIFEKIGEILSYINPFSENFFGKKLVDLILDGLKSLFVPEDGFFQSYFDEIQQWFSDRLGFLWTPFDIIIEVLERILNINFDEPIIKIPDIVEPFTGQKLISQQEYNLNSLLENEIFKNVHYIYFVCVDALIVFGLVNLTKKKIEEVFQN